MTFALALLLPLGCNDLSATVGGTVLLDGKPIEVTKSQRGMVIFRPVAGGATCSGLINQQGQYRISTGSRSAVTPGDYLVSARVVEIIDSGSSNRPPNGRPLTPAVYADPLTSGLQTTVKRGDNRFDIQLSSAAGPILAPQPEEEVTENEAEDAEDAEIADEADNAEPAADSEPTTSLPEEASPPEAPEVKAGEEDQNAP